MLAIDQSGNKLLEFVKISEEDAALQFSPITVCLIVVKIGKDYLMGFNHWRKDWEIFGGCPEKGETMREAMIRETKEELGIDCIPEWLGLAHFEMQPDYFSNVVREEYGAIFGVSLGEEYLEQIEKLRIDREEVEKIALLGEISSDEEIRELDRKLIDFY
ncbi:NUDIX hydrolase [Roseburia sp. AM59-24XD]|jgi:8-oxo-dGTP diphosphatase|uniref:NUDIX hydrolase n=1 Tax=Roseburia sp. AM59-24XD TaxID=2293138 RepID=UPI000E490918|nr:NUDIX hydrolase [Roseburia sp. AM59-24XD]RHP86760.1 NUDIX hydrolase [Roseburia sp. AM59-24XD]